MAISLDARVDNFPEERLSCLLPQLSLIRS